MSEILGNRPGWSVQDSPTPGVEPYWALLSSFGSTGLAVYVEGKTAHLYEEETDRDVTFGSAEELATWLDENRHATDTTPEPPHHILKWN
ncbi:MAG: hypothetical protein JO368_01570 [Acidimicrobiales bacterium]|nr:hypothetical protein [Acidimicrobiales bacterium]